MTSRYVFRASHLTRLKYSRYSVGGRARKIYIHVCAHKAHANNHGRGRGRWSILRKPDETSLYYRCVCITDTSGIDCPLMWCVSRATIHGAIVTSLPPSPLFCVSLFADAWLFDFSCKGIMWSMIARIKIGATLVLYSEEVDGDDIMRKSQVNFILEKSCI